MPSFHRDVAVISDTCCGYAVTFSNFAFLDHLLRDDLINPVKCPSVGQSVRTSTIKLNAATNQIVVFVRVDESFTMISLSRSSEVSVKVRR